MLRVLLALCLLATVCVAETYVVPEGVPTIQQALNLCVDGDTILVMPGVYSEALQAPNNLFFVMIGIFDTTKENDEWPIIDPSFLDSSDRKTCLRLPPQTTAVIKNIWFRNRWPMFPRYNGTVGGISNFSPNLTVQNCRFDSTHASLATNSGLLTVEDCEFRYHVGTAISKFSTTGLIVRDSEFHGGDMALHLAGNALVEGCWFSEKPGEWIWPNGPGITIRNCTFVAPPQLFYAVIWVGEPGGQIFEDNLFLNFNISYSGGLFWFGQGSSDSVIIRRNHFSGINCSGANSSGVMSFNQGSLFYVTGNVYDHCTGWPTRVMDPWNTEVVSEYNIYLGEAENAPLIRAHRDFNSDTRYNYENFAGTGWAIDGDGTWDINAEHCWWGDSTGPYHVTRNPTGQGATVTGVVDFDPWLLDSTDLDTTEVDTTEDDSTEDASDPLTLLPRETQMDVFPNPFNSTATIYLFLAEPGFYHVELYNTLGQRLADVWSGQAAGSHALTLDAEALGTGVYFVRLAVSGRDVAMTKVLLLK